MSEDCLFLNVFTKPQVGEKNKAVMVWFYGGGFSMGDSATPLYIGSKLAATQDVVVVTINYRMNVFGFPGAPTLPDQNLGILDQRLAVEWVRDNIVGFGGDPKRITIFGESAGSMSVDYYAYAWLDDPIVNGFISQSGTSMMTDQDYDYRKLVQLRNDAWYEMTQKLGCGGQDKGDETVKCAQGKAWQQVQAAIPGNKGQANVFQTGFGPIPDEKVLPNNYYARAKAGKLIMKVELSE
jgi:cholinesterase